MTVSCRADRFLVCSSTVLGIGLLLGGSVLFLSYFSLCAQMIADGEKVLCLWLYLTGLQYGALCGILLYCISQIQLIPNYDEADI